MIIGLFGFIGSGKNTAANVLQQDYGYVSDSFAATLKDVTAILFSWPRHLLEGDTEESRLFRETVDDWWAERLGMPNFTPRYALQYMGTEVLRNCLHPDIWILTLERRLQQSSHDRIVITDCRFANEADLIRRLGGKLVRIRRGSEPIWYDCALSETADADMPRLYPGVHLTEWKWLSIQPDYLVDNDGDVEWLKSKIRAVVSA